MKGLIRIEMSEIELENLEIIKIYIDSIESNPHYILYSVRGTVKDVCRGDDS